MKNSHSFGEKSGGFQRVTKNWNSRGSKADRSKGISKKPREKVSKRLLTKKRTQERDTKLWLTDVDLVWNQDYSSGMGWLNPYDIEYSCWRSYNHMDTKVVEKKPTKIVRLHLTTFRSPVIQDKSPHRCFYKALAPTKDFQILGGGVAWLRPSVFEQDVLLVLATFVPEIGFAGFAHHTYRFSKLNEESKIVTYAIEPVSLGTVERDEKNPEGSQWTIVKKKKHKGNIYAPTPGKEFSWSCKYLSATRSEGDCKFLQSQGMRCHRVAWHDSFGHGSKAIAEMGFEDLKTLFEANLIPSDEQIQNLDGLIGKCVEPLRRNRNNSMKYPQSREAYAFFQEDSGRPHPLPLHPPNPILTEKRNIRVEAYAGVNDNLKVFFCLSYFITDDWRYHLKERRCFEIYCFDLHEFLCVLARVKCVLEIREHGHFVYEANFEEVRRR